MPADYFLWDMDYLAYFNGIQRDGIQRVFPDLRRWEGAYLTVPAGDPATTV